MTAKDLKIKTDMIIKDYAATKQDVERLLLHNEQLARKFNDSQNDLEKCEIDLRKNR